MWLTAAMRSILDEMIAADMREDFEDAEIVCEGVCYLGNRRIHRGSVTRLLTIMAISDCSNSGGMERYRVNEIGRAAVVRPQVIQELRDALVRGGAYSIRENRIVLL